jgi:hypothetical protein
MMRISDAFNFRNTLTVITGVNPGAVTADDDADYPTTRVLLRLASSLGGRTSQWAGGLRDVDVNNSGRWRPTPAGLAAMNDVFAALTLPANAWAIRVLDPAVLPVLILSFNANTGLLTTAANTIPDQARVRIKGTKGVPGLNGIWRVQKLSDTTFTLIGWISSTFAITKSNGTIRLQSYVFQPISVCGILRSTSHRVGKPSGLLGGRRRRKLI